MRRIVATGLVLGGAIVFVAPPAVAQRQEPIGVDRPAVPMDSVARVPSQNATNDSIRKPPLSPRRAFFTSLLLPGYAQARLDRPTASMIYAAFEVLSIGMIRKSAQDLNEAKRAPKDSIFVASRTDPNTGQVVTNTYIQSPFTPDKIKARRTHYEDWIVALVFNHLISSADAYVAANLWDFRANVSVDAETKQTNVGVRKSF